MKINNFEENVLLERRNLKKYKKFNNILFKKFNGEFFYKIEKLKTYEINDIICIDIKTWYGVTYEELKKVEDYLGGFSDCRVSPANGTQMLIYFRGIHKEFFDKLEINLSSNKYNL